MTKSSVIYTDRAGYIKGYLRQDDYWWIEEFVIMPEFRGKGLAKILAKHLPQKCMLIALPFKDVGGFGLPKSKLINFYKSLGFIRRRHKQGYAMMVRN